jgi:hypothetical protein
LNRSGQLRAELLMRLGSRAYAKAGVSHSFLTDWPDGTGPWRLRWTPGRTLTGGYGLRRTGRTLSIDLRIRRLGVRVPPNALQVRGALPHPGGALFVLEEPRGGPAERGRGEEGGDSASTAAARRSIAAATAWVAFT